MNYLLVILDDDQVVTAYVPNFGTDLSFINGYIVGLRDDDESEKCDLIEDLFRRLGLEGTEKGDLEKCIIDDVSGLKVDQLVMFGWIA